MSVLSDYLSETSALLRDSRFQFTTKNNLTLYINKARREVAIRSCCLEAIVTGQAPFGTSAQPGFLVPGAAIPGTLPGAIANNANSPGAAATDSNNFNTIPGTELYPYKYAEPYLQGQYGGYKSLFYLRNVSVTWGGFKPTLSWMPWENLQAYARSFNIAATNYPSVWASTRRGENSQAWLWPIPSGASPAGLEWQGYCTPKELWTDDDYEAIPELFQGSIKYYAAYLAYLAMGRTNMAQIMLSLFESDLIKNSAVEDAGHTSSFYDQSWM